MKRTFLLMLLVMLAAAVLGVAMAEDAGYVLVAWKQFRYQSTLWVFVGLAALLWLLIYGVRRLLGLTLISGQLLNPWSSHNRMRRVQHATQQGHLELAAGHWSHALRLLGRAARLSQQPLTACLGAARAASELGELAQCEQFLQQAESREPKAALAVALTRAQLQIDRGEDAAARSSLQAIREKQPRHPQTLRLLLALLQRQQDWSAIHELLPDLRRQKTLAAPALDALERQARCALLEQAAAAAEPLPALQTAWGNLPKAVRQQPELIACQAGLLLRHAGVRQAEELLKDALRRSYDERLIALYAQTGSGDPSRQLASAEAWLQARPDSAPLLLALGRLAIRCQLWGKARDYLERSLQAELRAETCAELARLLATRFGETARSNQLFQQGLALLDSHPASLPAVRKD